MPCRQLAEAIRPLQKAKEDALTNQTFSEAARLRDMHDQYCQTCAAFGRRSGF